MMAADARLLRARLIELRAENERLCRQLPSSEVLGNTLIEGVG
jgi:hypothetical protein